MADTNQSRRADASAFTDNDPFAELARIMGHEPSAPQAVEPARGNAYAAPSRVEPKALDDFDIDLEKELMGDLDFADFDEPRSPDIEPASDWRVSPVVSDPLPAQDWRADAAAPASYPSESDEPTIALVDHDAAEPAFQGAAPHDASEAFDVDHSVEDLAASIMEEDLADAIDLPMAHHEPVLAAQPEPVVAYDVPHGAHAHAEEALLDQEMDWAPEEVEEFDAVEPAAEWPQPQAAAATAAVTPADLDFDTSFLDEDDAAQEPIAEARVEASETLYRDEPALRKIASAAAFDPVAAAPVSGGAMSLEDELSALLARSDAPQPEVAPVAAPAAMASRATSNAFGRANFASQPGSAATASWQPVQVEQAAPPVFASLPEQPAPAITASAASASVMPAPAMLDVDDFADIFDDEPTEQVKAPVHVSAPAAATMQGWQAGHADLPEVETVEMIETAHPLVDDLDIPDIDFGALEAQPRPFDDLDGEFAQAFDDLVDDSDRSRPVAAAPIAMPTASDGWNDAGFDTWQHTPSSAPAAHEAEADAYAVGEGRWQAADTGTRDGFDFDDELEDAIALSNFEEQPAAAPRARGRGFVVAAVVVAVAAIGGAGVLGMSFLGGGSDSPAFVRADTDPMKVRPENPGGTTVPNQDSEAYARVSGDTPSTAPAQETLITTAEEPLDVAAETAPPAPAGLAPGISEEDAESALAPLPADAAPATDTLTAATQPKGDDRIEPADQAAVPGLADELAVVAPRRVRTMIVRPDGTMVPREEAGPAAEETVAAVPPMAPLAAPEAAPVTAEDPAVAEDAGPTVDTPPTVGVVPSQRSEPAPAAVAAAPAAPQPVTQTPAATPASAPAAAAPVAAGASEWSMQIASQPTAEGAQSTYQDLARRYGSVLEGRGVNIVKADIAGKGTYYRVRIPSASRDEAINLCTRYKNAGGSCFVSR